MPAMTYIFFCPCPACERSRAMAGSRPMDGLRACPEKPQDIMWRALARHRETAARLSRRFEGSYWADAQLTHRQKQEGIVSLRKLHVSGGVVASMELSHAKTASGYQVQIRTNEPK